MVYNLMFGTNPLAEIWLESLRLRPGDCGRWRDTYLQRGESSAFEIHVFTRNGGGNRSDYANVTERLRQHPRYLRDFDHEYDNTYASYVFKPTDEQVFSLINPIADAPFDFVIPASPDTRFKDFMERMQTSPNDADIERVSSAVKKALETAAKGQRQ